MIFWKKEKLIKYAGFDDRWTMLVGIIGLALVMPIVFFREPGEPFQYWRRVPVTLVYVAFHWVPCRAIMLYAHRRFPDLQEVGRRVVFTLIAIILLVVTVNFSLDYLSCFFLGEVCPPEEGFGVDPPAFLITILVSAIYESVFLYKQLEKSVQERERLERENIQSQLEGLRNQVNPHFLFNSLNTLTFLIPEDPHRAVEFVRKLSQTYRYILEMRDKKVVSLKEELEFLKAYLFLLKERFGENLQFTMDIPAEYHHQQILPLSLQLLLENAIKHNVISRQKPLKVHLKVEGKHLILQNHLQLKQQKQPSTGTGLDNIRRRYRFFTDREIMVESGPDHFTVMLPLLQIKNSFPQTVPV